MGDRKEPRQVPRMRSDPPRRLRRRESKADRMVVRRSSETSASRSTQRPAGLSSRRALSRTWASVRGRFYDRASRAGITRCEACETLSRSAGHGLPKTAVRSISERGCFFSVGMHLKTLRLFPRLRALVAAANGELAGDRVRRERRIWFFHALIESAEARRNAVSEEANHRNKPAPATVRFDVPDRHRRKGSFVTLAHLSPSTRFYSRRARPGTPIFAADTRRGLSLPFGCRDRTFLRPPIMAISRPPSRSPSQQRPQLQIATWPGGG